MTPIRQAGQSDLEAVLGLDSALFGDEAWGRASVEAELVREDGASVVLLASIGADVIGFAAVRTGPDTADLLRIGVRRDHQRGGVGSALLGEAARHALRAGCERLLLEVASDNEAALELYARRGFVGIAVRPRYYPAGADAVVMQRYLSGNRLDEQGDA